MSYSQPWMPQNAPQYINIPLSLQMQYSIASAIDISSPLPLSGHPGPQHPLNQNPPLPPPFYPTAINPNSQQVPQGMPFNGYQQYNNNNYAPNFGFAPQAPMNAPVERPPVPQIHFGKPDNNNRGPTLKPALQAPMNAPPATQNHQMLRQDKSLRSTPTGSVISKSPAVQSQTTHENGGNLGARGADVAKETTTKPNLKETPHSRLSAQASSSKAPVEQDVKNPTVSAPKATKHVHIDTEQTKDTSQSKKPLAKPTAAASHPSPTPVQTNDVQFSDLFGRLRHPSTLKDLEINPRISIDVCRGLLQQIPTLESLYVNLGPPSSISDLESSTSYPELKSSLETLVINTWVHPGPLLENLALQNLAYLTIRACNGNFSRSTDIGFLKLLTNSGCSLKSLTMIDVYPKESELIPCLRLEACQSLEDLIVRPTVLPEATTPYSKQYITTPTIELLGNEVDSCLEICPHLVCIKLGPLHDVPSDVFVDMVKARLHRHSLNVEYAFRRHRDSEGVFKKLSQIVDKHRLESAILVDDWQAID